MALPPPIDLIAFGENSRGLGVDGYVHRGFTNRRRGRQGFAERRAVADQSPERRRGRSFVGTAPWPIIRPNDAVVDHSPKAARIDLIAEGD